MSSNTPNTNVVYANREEGVIDGAPSFYGTPYIVNDGTKHGIEAVQEAATSLRTLCKALGRGNIPQEQFVNELEMILDTTRKALQTAARYNRKRTDYEASN